MSGSFLFSRLKYSISKITFMNEKLMLSEEYKLMIFENGVLRNIFAPNMKEVTGDSGNFTVDIHDLYCSSKIFGVISIVMLGWAGIRGIYTREDKCMQGFSGETKWKETILKL